MPAVLEARSMLCAVPLDLSRGESKGVWLMRAARLLGLAPAKAKRIYYGEVKRIDADTFAGMRARLENLKAQADASREQLNALIYARHEIARARQAHRALDPGSGSGGLDPHDGREASEGAGPRHSTTTAARG